MNTNDKTVEAPAVDPASSIILCGAPSIRITQNFKFLPPEPHPQVFRDGYVSGAALIGSDGRIEHALVESYVGGTYLSEIEMEGLLLGVLPRRSATAVPNTEVSDASAVEQPTVPSDAQVVKDFVRERELKMQAVEAQRVAHPRDRSAHHDVDAALVHQAYTTAQELYNSCADSRQGVNASFHALVVTRLSALRAEAALNRKGHPHLISFEGIDGAGKTTQIKLLQARIIAAGFKCEVLREPGGTGLGEQIRKVLLDAKKDTNIHAEAELLLFAASRAQLVRDKVKPLLEADCFVIMDRFIDSTVAYQGDGRGLDKDFIHKLNEFATGGLTPGMTFLLDLPAETARARRDNNGEPDRMEAEADAFFARVRAGFLALAKTNARTYVLDAGRSQEDLGALVWALVMAALPELCAVDLRQVCADNVAKDIATDEIVPPAFTAFAMDEIDVPAAVKEMFFPGGKGMDKKVVWPTALQQYGINGIGLGKKEAEVAESSCTGITTNKQPELPLLTRVMIADVNAEDAARSEACRVLRCPPEQLTADILAAWLPGAKEAFHRTTGRYATHCVAVGLEYNRALHISGTMQSVCIESGLKGASDRAPGLCAPTADRGLLLAAKVGPEAWVVMAAPKYNFMNDNPFVAREAPRAASNNEPDAMAEYAPVFVENFYTHVGTWHDELIAVHKRATAVLSVPITAVRLPRQLLELLEVWAKMGVDKASELLGLKDGPNNPEYLLGLRVLGWDRDEEIVFYCDAKYADPTDNQ
jgi:dTMP kinase